MALPCAIERRSDGTLLGWIGVIQGTATGRRTVLGYWLGEEHHGPGYMRETAAQPGNEPSFAVLRGCGMVPAGERVIFAPARSRDELYLVHEVARPIR